ncbi:MAG: nucleoside triphosphate pyrophosphohydrolase [Armatimonadetes bacterium]|nr:nucleoside triphosphate pyrophosphohydrolase [Armatimonadota bacterium]
MEEFRRLVDIMARLRAADGCPWDREQSHGSLKPYLLEETYEVLEAIDAGNDAKLCEELGDLLLQIVFHAQIGAEERRFNADDVCRSIADKLLNRHPHVFGEAQARDSDEVIDNWERIKRAEPLNEDRASILDGVPHALPALQKATKVQKRVAKVGFDWDDHHGPAGKVREELGEVEQAAEAGDEGRLVAEIGDLLFAVVNLARRLGIDSEDALRQGVARFSTRFRLMEQRAEADGIRMQELSLAELDELWDAAKAVLEPSPPAPLPTGEGSKG